ncbi:hypothetical protein F0562_017040 [Nyssa sinensis]|uniref:Uncharacterized protein n=1 Tax=Nyssa sinensis TaxID=561372 RepID=A0A5J4ZGN0_9ASTE|nr:hypothetical protein F0562_017040 [Nyssa sinensis]
MHVEFSNALSGAITPISPLPDSVTGDPDNSLRSLTLRPSSTDLRLRTSRSELGLFSCTAKEEPAIRIDVVCHSLRLS